MAIKKMSSQEYNKILEDATNKIENMSNNMNHVKNDIYKKMNIINYEQEYLNYIYDKTQYSTIHDDTFIFLNDNRHDGLYDGYSNVVHAHFKNTPINVFNLKVLHGTESFFRDEVTVKINNVEDEAFKNILKANDVKDKEIFFEEYEVKSKIKQLKDGSSIEEKNDEIKILIKTDNSKVIGASKFNVIELDPYLYKSFDITSINVYEDDGEVPATTVNNIKKVGKTRIILDKKYDFNKVEFTIKLNFISTLKEKELMPFGLKHIFFLEADFRSDSYMIVQYNSESFIDDINDIVEVITPLGSRKSSITQESIQIFLAMNNGMLENEQSPSNEIKRPIARNLKNIFFKIPLRNESITGYKFIINKR